MAGNPGQNSFVVVRHHYRLLEGPHSQSGRDRRLRCPKILSLSLPRVRSDSHRVPPRRDLLVVYFLRHASSSDWQFAAPCKLDSPRCSPLSTAHAAHSTYRATVLAWRQQYHADWLNHTLLLSLKPLPEDLHRNRKEGLPLSLCKPAFSRQNTSGSPCDDS